MANDEQLAAAGAALAEGRWEQARDRYEAAFAAAPTGEASFGLAAALWWLGESVACVDCAARAYALYRSEGDDAGAAYCAVWLAIAYKANFASPVVAAGWLRRAERLLGPGPPGPLHGWLWIARGYREADLDLAADLSRRAAELGGEAGDVDLELVAMSQLGLVTVAAGDAESGFALIDEVLAAVLGGERTTLDTVVYTCCDMLNACELTGDVERAAQWSKVADGFVERYGCPFLYAECRIYHGSVLVARGRWEEADRELGAGLRITDGTCPGLHDRALVRLAGLRVRQGRLEEADRLLGRVGAGVQAEAEQALAVAALHLARGDGDGARRTIEQRRHRLDGHATHLTAALDLLVDAHLSIGDVATAASVAARLVELAVDGSAGQRTRAVADGAAGRIAIARSEPEVGIGLLDASLAAWSAAERPYEVARTHLGLAEALAGTRPELAVDHARRAMSGFEVLGAGPDADRAAALLRSLGVTGRPQRRTTGTLTRREQEVLQLLGAGLTNPEIAGRLHLSRKTVSHHVSSILGKLGLRNRTEAAAFAVAPYGERRPMDTAPYGERRPRDTAPYGERRPRDTAPYGERRQLDTAPERSRPPDGSPAR